MAEKGEFGTKIPGMKDIVKIDGDRLLDADGDEFDKRLIQINKELGGGYELIRFPEAKRGRPKKSKT